MNELLIDTDIIIHALNGDERTLVFLEENLTSIIISTISVGEILRGARNKSELTAITKTLNYLKTIAVSENAQLEGIKLFKEYKLKHGIGFYDCLIAATALEQDLTLVSNNSKHFSFIPGLKLSKLSEL